MHRRRQPADWLVRAQRGRRMRERERGPICIALRAFVTPSSARWRGAYRPSRWLNRWRSSNQRPGRTVETAETPNSIIVSGIVIVISRSIGKLTGKRASWVTVLLLFEMNFFFKGIFFFFFHFVRVFDLYWFKINLIWLYLSSHLWDQIID